MFKIEIIDDEKNPKIGKITIDDFNEIFEVHPFTKNSINIFEYWNSQLLKLINGEDYIVLQYDPRFAWVIYNNDGICYFQNIMALDGNFMTHTKRNTITEDGDAISEWETELSSIKTYLNE